MAHFSEDGPALLLRVKLTPRASSDAIKNISQDQVGIRVTSPPVDNKANEHLVKFLAKRLKVPRSKISIVRGRTSKNKVLRIEGLNLETAETRLSK